jgi:flagellar hook assembly protein FlgD
LRAVTASPNPFRGAIALRFQLAQAGAVNVEVFDAQGRRVRGVASGLRSAGASSLSWDGRDDTGTRVAAGTYFVRVAARLEERTVRVVLLP